MSKQKKIHESFLIIIGTKHPKILTTVSDYCLFIKDRINLTYAFPLPLGKSD